MNEDRIKRGLANSKFLTAVAISALFLSSGNAMAAQTNTDSSLEVTEQLQVQTVSGLVVDASGDPVIGASVVEIGTTNGIITDMDGKFTLTGVPNVAKAVLIVRYVGMEEAKEPLKGRTSNINIHMKEAVGMLDDVVVIGYGTQRKSDLTGSVTNVSSKDFNMGLVSSPEQLINGKISGVQIMSNSGSPTSGSTIRVRGGASLNASNDPLIVLDGVPLEQGGISGNDGNFLSLINPNDIESMTILKDASSTAIYGSRASNGVILITTKKGKVGKPVINFSTKLTYSPKLNIDRLNLLNSEEKVGLELDLLASGYPYRETKGEVYRIISGLGELNNFKDGGWNALSSSATVTRLLSPAASCTLAKPFSSCAGRKILASGLAT